MSRVTRRAGDAAARKTDERYRINAIDLLDLKIRIQTWLRTHLPK